MPGLSMPRKVRRRSKVPEGFRVSNGGCHYEPIEEGDCSKGVSNSAIDCGGITKRWRPSKQRGRPCTKKTKNHGIVDHSSTKRNQSTSTNNRESHTKKLPNCVDEQSTARESSRDSRSGCENTR
jgi:hypothetical protein